VQSGAEGCAGYAVGQRPAADRVAVGTTQAMESVFVDLRLDGRQLGHLVAPRLGVLTAQGMTASSALRRLAVGDRGAALGRYQGPHPAGMPLLPAPALLRRRLGRLPLDADRVGRRRPGAVGGVLVEARLEILNLLPQLDDLPLQAVDDGPHDDAGHVREAIPDVLGDRGRPVHAVVIIDQS
jgi:hypothetical protein